MNPITDLLKWIREHKMTAIGFGVFFTTVSLMAGLSDEDAFWPWTGVFLFGVVVMAVIMWLDTVLQ